MDVLIIFSMHPEFTRMYLFEGPSQLDIEFYRSCHKKYGNSAQSSEFSIEQNAFLNDLANEGHSHELIYDENNVDLDAMPTHLFEDGKGDREIMIVHCGFCL